MKKTVVLLFILISFIPHKCSAISAQSAVLIDSTSGRVLYEHNAHQKLPMASTTKIMTGLLAVESGKLSESVKTSAFASGTEGSSLWLKIGEKQTLENLTYGLMLKSGNDAAVAISEHLGGNTDAFALMMNERAKKIGALNTSFKNPHGLDSEGHYTTAYDLALIAREAMKNKKFREIVSTKNYSIPMEGEKWNRALKNHNKLLWQYDGCNGIKTGYTKKCGRCLVSSAKRNGLELICVTLNASDDWNDHKYLLDCGFENYYSKTAVNKGEIMGEIETEEGKVFLVTKNGVSLTLKNGEETSVKTIVTKKTLPIKKDEKLGVVEIYSNGEKVGETPLVAEKTVKKAGFFQKILKWFKLILKKLHI